MVVLTLCLPPASWGPSGLFRELFKIFSRNLCFADIVLVVRISNWNFIRVPKAMLWAHVQSFNLKFSPLMWFLVLSIFRRLFWRARETLVKQPPELSIPSVMVILPDFDDFFQFRQNSTIHKDLEVIQPSNAHFSPLSSTCSRTRKGTARLLFHQLSTEASRHYRHLEVSQWQGFVLGPDAWRLK